VPLCLRANGEPGAHVRVHVLVVDVIVPACVGVGVARLEGIARGGLFSGARNERKTTYQNPVLVGLRGCRVRVRVCFFGAGFLVRRGGSSRKLTLFMPFPLYIIKFKELL